jgi:heme exporter protein A
MTNNNSLTSGNSTHVLEARALTCVRGDKQLFSGLSLKALPGSCLHIRGENGVGKTSLLRLLTGLAKPDMGEVFWDGVSISADPLAYHKDLLFMGHREALKEDLTALENLQIYAALDAVVLPEEKALAALWRFGLRGREHLPISFLSAGQKRRILMARMLTRQAKLWILDEPFNALDVNAVRELEGLISEQLASGGAVVLTSHQEVRLPNLQALDL